MVSAIVQTEKGQVVTTHSDQTRRSWCLLLPLVVFCHSSLATAGAAGFLDFFLLDRGTGWTERFRRSTVEPGRILWAETCLFGIVPVDIAHRQLSASGLTSGRLGVCPDVEAVESGVSVECCYSG